MSLAVSSSAGAFVINATLTGDVRDANPNALVVELLILADEINSPNVAS